MDDADTELERGVESVRDSLRRTSADGKHRLELTYTNLKLGPMV